MLNFKFWKRKKNKLGISPETVKKVIPEVKLEVETKVVDVEEKKISTAVVYEQPKYVEPSDKEIIEGLEFCDNYEAAYLIRSLKKENAVLKGKLTKLKKKYDASEADRQMYMKQLNHLHGKTSAETPKSKPKYYYGT